MKPAHDLGLVKGLMKDGSWNVTVSALDTAVELGFDEESEKKPGLMQDVYYITYQDLQLYVKLQVVVNAVVISFKER
jgi:hypothetical protein